MSLNVVVQIERANIVNFDWALAHMDSVKSKKTRRKTGTAEDWVYETEIKDMGEDVSVVLNRTPESEAYAYKCRRISRALVLSSWTTVRVMSISRALIKILKRFCVSVVPEEREDNVARILGGRGIKYSHRNDDILVPNTIEEQQMKKARKVRDIRCLFDQTRSLHYFLKKF